MRTKISTISQAMLVPFSPNYGKNLEGHFTLIFVLSRSEKANRHKGEASLATCVSFSYEFRGNNPTERSLFLFVIVHQQKFECLKKMKTSFLKLSLCSCHSSPYFPITSIFSLSLTFFSLLFLSLVRCSTSPNGQRNAVSIYFASQVPSTVLGLFIASSCSASLTL